MTKVNNTLNYLKNGRSQQSFPVVATKFENKSKHMTKFVHNGNGKLFDKKLNDVMQKINKEIENGDKNQKTNIISWVFKILNPLNHLPIVSTIKKLSDRTNDTLDMAQSAIGGAIYGGGPVGLAKGLGGWFISKILPKNVFANNRPSGSTVINEEKKKDSSLINNRTNKEKIKINTIKDSKVTNPEIINKTNTQGIKDKYHKVNDYINYYHNIEKTSSKKIDVKA